jgi:hypothetical protein
MPGITSFCNARIILWIKKEKGKELRLIGSDFSELL